MLFRVAPVTSLSSHPVKPNLLLAFSPLVPIPRWTPPSNRLNTTCHIRPPSARPLSRLPNLLTYARILTIPLVCLTELHPALTQTPFSPLLFTLASITDFLDGYLARRWNCQTALGAFLDPVADKLLVAVTLTFTILRFPIPSIAIPAAAILTREIFISALREWCALQGFNATVKVSILGKLKTTTQMLALIFLLIARTASSVFLQPGIVLLALAAALALYSAGDYSIAAIRQYNKVQSAM